MRVFPSQELSRRLNVQDKFPKQDMFEYAEQNGNLSPQQLANRGPTKDDALMKDKLNKSVNYLQKGCFN